VTDVHSGSPIEARTEREHNQNGVPRQQAWDHLLSGAGAGLLQSWRWGEFKRQAGWEPVRLASAIRNGTAAQVLFRRLPRLPLPVSVAYIPRGPVALGDGEESSFWESAHKAARRRGAIFLKVEPPWELGPDLSKEEADRRMEALGFKPAGRLQPSRTIVLDLGGTEDDLLKAMKPKTRYNLRLAGRRGVIVRRAESESDLRQFFSLLQVTGERDDFGIHTYPYYEQMWRTFGPEGSDTALILLADHPEEEERAKGPIAGLLALRFGHEAIYMYGASDNRGREHMPNYLLQWEATQWAREHGCTVYDFWGIPDAPQEEGDEEGSAVNARAGLRGVYWFKKGFGGREIEYPGAYDYVYNRLLYRIWMRWRGAELG
jgi:peptidoglycan pentaglycine glycine transferase (the first glycine)